MSVRPPNEDPSAPATGTNGSSKPSGGVVIGVDKLGLSQGLQPAPQPGVFRPPRPLALIDGERRRVEYLRLSLTDRCNFRCRYCMPAEGMEWFPRSEVLSFDEIERLVRVFVQLGVERVRLTGGEPLLRKDCVELVARIAAVDGVKDLAMTTNGAFLRRDAADLVDAGLTRINISIDTLHEERFSTITRTGRLDVVLDGIDAAIEAGLTPVKLNAVVVRGFNDDELADLVHYAADVGAVLRFIEFMPIGVDGFWSGDTFVDTAEMIRTLERSMSLAEPIGYGAAAGITGEGPALYRDATLPDGRVVRLGFISALSHNFCERCNRVRVTATGELQECLAYAGSVSLRDTMRAGATDEQLIACIEDGLFGKGAGHGFDAADGGVRTPRAMSAIGG